MKKWMSILPVLAILALSCGQNNSQIANPNGSDTLGLLMNTDNNAAKNLAVNDQTFYQALKPYGKWTSYGSYGNVWIPNEGKSFRPYSTHGHWVYSDAGWVWNSDYSWGWAPFHYGRWNYDDSEGWMWVPGTEWAPAWVTWGRCDGYYGWAPLAPGISIDVSVGRGWNAPREYWNCVPDREFVREGDYGNVVNVYSDPAVFGGFYNHVTIINNRPERDIYRNYNNGVVYNAGPNVRDVERFSHARVQPVVLRESANTVENINNRQMNIYSPVINNNVQRNRINRQVNRNVTFNQQVNNAPQNNNPQNRNQNQQNIVQQNNRNGNRQFMQQQDNHAAFNPATRNQSRTVTNNPSVSTPQNTNNGRNSNHDRSVNQPNNLNNNRRENTPPVNTIKNNPAPQTRDRGNQQHRVQTFAPQHQQTVNKPQVQSQPQVQHQMEVRQRPQQVQRQQPQVQQQVQHINAPQAHNMPNRVQNNPQPQVHQNQPAPQRNNPPQNRPAPQNHPAPQQKNGNDKRHD